MMNPQRLDLLPTQHERLHTNHRLALLQSMAASVEELKRDPANRHRYQPSDPSDTPTARAAANIATWREYLPEDCVTAMINDGWHWST